MALVLGGTTSKIYCAGPVTQVLTQQTTREGRLLMQRAFHETFMGGHGNQADPLELGFLNERQMKQVPVLLTPPPPGW